MRRVSGTLTSSPLLVFFILWRSVAKHFGVFRRWLVVDIGDGHTVRFWQDIWVGNVPCPELYQLAWNQWDLVHSQRILIDGRC